MERHFANAFFTPAKRSATRDLRKGATVHDQTCTHVHWFTWGAFWASIVNCNLINDNNWTVTNLRTCIIVERNFSTKFIKNSFPDKCLYIFFSWLCRTPSWSLSSRFRYTLYNQITAGFRTICIHFACNSMVNHSVTAHKHTPVVFYFPDLLFRYLASLFPHLHSSPYLQNLSKHFSKNQELASK